MYLDKLVISGFKSFAKQTEFKFEHEFTAIVGPNGSGKTNVADALRWVMGEQSLKLIRMKQATDAIFAGSADRGRLSLARVDLHLNNHDGRLKIEYPEVVISRQITRDGETEYLINNATSRLQDILLLLAQANFGQKSYGVIGQGMITDILNANPQDRKEFFDEATGVKEFQMKRDQAINKLIRTEENLIRVDDLLNEIEPRLKSLTRQVKKLEQRKELEQQLHGVQTQYYGARLVQLRTELAQLQTRQADLKADQTILANELATTEQAIDKIGQAESRTSIYERLQHEYNQVMARKNNVLKEQAVLKGRMEVEHERRGEIELLWLQRQLEDKQQALTNQQAELMQWQASHQHQAVQLEKILAAQAGVKKDAIKLETELNVAKDVLIKLSENLSLPEVKQRLEDLFKHQEQFLRELLSTTSLDQFKAMQKQAHDITDELAELLDELHAERREDVALQQRTITTVTQQLQTTTGLKEKLLQDSTELRVKTQHAQDQITSLKNRNTQLDAEVSRMQADIKHRQQAESVKEQKDAQVVELRAQTEQLEAQLSTLDEELSLKKLSLDEFNQAEEAKQQRLLELQTQARQIQTKLNRLSNEVQSVEIQVTKLQTKQEDVITEAERLVPAEIFICIQAWQEARTDYNELLLQIERLQHQLELIGGIDPEIVQEYEQTEQRFTFLNTQSKDMAATITSLEKIIDELDGTIKKQFNHAFKSITKSFSKYFSILFPGGVAKLVLLTDDDNDPETITQSNTNQIDGVSLPENVDQPQNPVRRFIGKEKKKHHVASGIDIVAQPAGKKINSVHALSGGEKSMTAIALICAIIDANTPPFVVLDEVEAALDESNSEKFSAIVKQLSTKTQFVLITHNRSSMHQADVLFGVTMKQGTSHILSVKLTEAEQLLDTTPVSPQAAVS